MEPIQFQVVAHLVQNQFHVQVTSGVDIFIESQFKHVGDDLDKEWVKGEIQRAFLYALNAKIKGGE